MEQVVLHFVTFAGGEPITPIIQLAKVLRVSRLSERTLQTAEVKARELGLMPRWKQELQEAILPEHIKHKGFDTNVADSSLVSFLIDVIKRDAKIHDPIPPHTVIDETAALCDLCTPVVVGIFRYTDGLRGLTACLEQSRCGQAAHDASGLTFIDNKPDIVWKYVPIHELGHYFGLCHVAGVERIMFTPKGQQGQNLSWWEVLKKSFTWLTLPKLLLTKGEPTFTLEEAMQAWDYIIEHFPPSCLGSHVEPPVIL